MEHLTEEQIIEYLESGAEDLQIIEHLENCNRCKQEVKQTEELMLLMKNSLEYYKVPGQIAEQLSEEIHREMNAEKKTRPWFQVAAAVALLIVGFGVGKWSVPDRSAEVLALESQVNLLKEMSMISVLNRPSASQRIQAVNQINEETNNGSNETVINTLIKTLNTDESPNVRYQAAQALKRFSDQEMVRLSLAKSLERQIDPLIQIALISILLESQEKNAVRPLRRILERENTSPEVKKQAEIALEILI